MRYEERKNMILGLLDINDSVSHKELSEYLGVSEATIRRDLNVMENKQELIRFWGGARRNPDRPHSQRNIVEGMISESKKIVGEIAANLIKNNALIFIGSGVTTLTMINYIQTTNITVITNGISQLEALKNRNIKAFLLCGFLKEYSRAVVGRQTVEMLAQYHFDIAFLGANGLDANMIPLSADVYEHDIKNICIQNSKESYVMVDHTKFNRSAMYKLSPEHSKQISIITDKKVSDNCVCNPILRGYILENLQFNQN